MTTRPIIYFYSISVNNLGSSHKYLPMKFIFRELGKNIIFDPSLLRVAIEYETEFIKVL